MADADRLVEAAERGGAMLATGHTERFNPAVAAALPIISDPRFIEIHRLGTFPERSLDIDVIFDLMIHDLDLLLRVVRSEVTGIEAVGVNVLTPKADIANARLRFASGCIANVTASRISRERVRKARFFQNDAYVSIDYAAQELEVFRLVKNGPRPIIHVRGAGRGQAARPACVRAHTSRECDAPRRCSARIRGRLRNVGSRKEGADHRRTHPVGRQRCGRISSQRDRALHDPVDRCRVILMCAS